MRKLLLVSIGLCTFTLVLAGTRSTDGTIVADQLNKRTELIKPGADGRVTVTAELLSGVSAKKERLNATKAPKVPMPDTYILQKNRKELDAARMEKRQRDDAAMEKARVDRQNMPAPAPAPSGSSYYHKSQWSQPFQAHGNDSVLSHIELLYSQNTEAFRKFGERVFVYDKDGEVISSEYTIKNVNGIVSEIGSWSAEIPENATIKMVSFESDTLMESSTYYIDPTTGDRHDISINKTVYYNGEVVTMIREELDKAGNMVVYGKVESEFDGQGRPVVTIRYSSYMAYDPATGTQTSYLTPSRKTEYEYLSNGLVTVTESYYEYDPTINANVWRPSNRLTKGTDDEGVYYYEYLYYSTSDNDWVGSSKYTTLEKETPNGDREVTQTTWRWNNSNKEWTVSGRQFNRYNSKGYRTLAEFYSYSTTLQTFYLSSVDGYEYLGDTARCAEWYLSYRTPDSIPQLDNQMSLLSYGSKTEYADYTLQELGWTSSDEIDFSLPRKYEIRYTIDKNNKQSISWINESKVEYDYKLATITGSDYTKSLKMAQREYLWNEDDWFLNYEYRYDYNDHGDRILDESYQNGHIFSRQTREYVYFYRTDSYGDRYQDHRVIAEARWSLSNGVLTPISAYEYGYDDAYNYQTLTIGYSSWDVENNRWMRGNKYEYAFDNNDNPLLYIAYNWNVEKGVWVGSSKEATEYNSKGDITKREYWYNDSDTLTVWTPSYIQEANYDANGNMILSQECYNWTGESWDYGNRSEWAYSADGQLLSLCESYMSSGVWYGSNKEEYEYNANGQITQSMHYQYYGIPGQEWMPQRKEVYTYTDTNELLSLYSYVYDGTDWSVIQKSVALVEGGVITAYADSIYDSWENVWTPNSLITITRDETTGIVTSLYQDWDSSNNEWQNNRKESLKYDSEGREIYRETYYWDTKYDYNTGDYVHFWNGDEKAEYAYGDNGHQIMTATYYWDSYDTLWVGSNKYESDYDDNGREILNASYYWDYNNHEWYGSRKTVSAYDSQGRETLYIYYEWDFELKDWVGDSKSEYEYDENGNQVMSAYYNGMDSEGNWIGSSKYSYYTKDGITYNERYEWDYDRNDWYGMYKDEYCYDENYYMSTSYVWDYDGWCWVGSEKREETYNGNVEEIITYKWDAATTSWIASQKEQEEVVETPLSSKFIYTDSEWDSRLSRWIPTNRGTEEAAYHANDNLDYQLMRKEVYKPVTSTWAQSYTVKMVYVYKSLTGVGQVSVEMSIRVDDGKITVNAPVDSAIRISAVSGSQVASGKGQLEAAVAPGIYLITVDGKTTKVVVR